MTPEAGGWMIGYKVIAEYRRRMRGRAPYHLDQPTESLDYERDADQVVTQMLEAMHILHDGD